jgi:hypothetical protein
MLQAAVRVGVLEIPSDFLCLPWQLDISHSALAPPAKTLFSAYLAGRSHGKPSGSLPFQQLRCSCIALALMSPRRAPFTA